MEYLYANKFSLARSETDVFISFLMRVPEFDDKGTIVGEKNVDRRDIVITVDAARALKGMLEDILNAEKPEG